MHTVIVGGGFAGVKTALELSRYQSGRVTLISDREHFVHHATLYSTATGHDPKETMIPLKEIFAAHPEVTVVHDTLTSLDPERNLVVCGHKNYPYDALVMALGTEIDYGGLREAEQHTFGIRNLEQITRLHDHLHDTLVHDHHVDRNYVVVGGGLTGVELAGVLAAYIEQLSGLYLSKKATVSITLAEQSSRLLPDFSIQASTQTRRRLESLGVQVVTDAKVTALSHEYITLGTKKIPTHTVIWATGGRNNSFYAQHPQYFDITAAGHVRVNPYLEAYRDIYVLGDNIDIRGRGHATSALDMATFVADHLVRRATGKLYLPYRAKRRPLAVPIGDDWAYVEYLGVYTTGRLGKYFQERIVYDGYRQILPKTMADAAVAAHTTKIEQI